VSLPPFQQVLDEHRGDLYRFVIASVGPNDADDCFQETCVAAMRAYPRLSSRQNLRGWLFRIAQRKAIDFHRAHARRPLPVAAVPEQGTAAGEDGQPGLWAEVLALPAKQRGAVFLRCVLGSPYSELAASLDCSEEAARRSVHEGLRKLRKGAESWSTSSVS
jgi:DNA-directed RNA polymerase specialized sigma24 family protein